MSGNSYESRLCAVYNELAEIGARQNVAMSDCTSFRIGGEASVYLELSGKEHTKLIKAFETAAAHEVECIVIGNGSNLLVADEGIKALVICIKGSEDIAFFGNELHCDAAVMLSRVAKEAAVHGLSGLEWAAGIPGTVGGAIAMNAGAYGGEIKNVLREVTCFSKGKVLSACPAQGDMGYRHSAFSFPQAVILSACFVLECGVEDEIKEQMNELLRKRAEKQPLAYPSAGSVFKRPEGHFAGALIEQAGLKGVRVGNAAVSTKHAGFIVNMGGATSHEVEELISLIQKRVFEHSGVMLQTEIKRIGG